VPILFRFAVHYLNVPDSCAVSMAFIRNLSFKRLLLFIVEVYILTMTVSSICLYYAAAAEQAYE
jgi:hypothetical protein